MEYFRNIYPHVNKVKTLINQNDKIIIFDTETTGLEEDAKIIQFSAVLYEKRMSNNGNIRFVELEHFDTYINPGEELKSEIIELTGITNEHVQSEAKEDVKIHQIKEFMSKANLWAAYNANFDLLKLQNTFIRTGVTAIEKDCIDVLEMARNVIHKADINNHRLSTVTEYLYPNYQAAYHNSLEDVRATGKCLEGLFEEYKNIRTPIFPDRKIKVNNASFWQNPNMGSMRRITIWSDSVAGRNTGIFWSCKDACFSCKSDKNSKQFADVFILLPVLIDKGLFSFFGYFSIKLSVFFVTPADL